MVAGLDPTDVTWISDNVAITNFPSAHDKELLANHRVDAVLCLDRELEGSPSHERGVACIRVVHLVDGMNEMAQFRQAVDALAFRVQRHGRVVAHCRAGRSRSIAVVAGYLRRVLGVEADEALGIVRSKREAAVAPELIDLVERFEP